VGDAVVNLTAAPRAKMAVGMNYPIPWNAYGIYLGGGFPPASNPTIDLWLPNLRNNLIHLREVLGMRVVRIFLLCNAFNYGSGKGSAFTPPATLHPKFTDHLEGMLQIFQDERMKVIPSLIDFKAFGKPPGGGCSERFAIAKDATVRATFFSQVLDEFLTRSERFRQAIFAWEVMNEPFWNMSRVSGLISPGIAGGRTLTEDEMKTFLSQALDLIEKTHGFPSTVGHRFSGDLDDFPTGTQRQFHFYPLGFAPDIPGLGDPSLPVGVPGADEVNIVLKDHTLPPWSETRAFIGEFGTAGKVGDAYKHGQPWPELNGADNHGPRSSARERLKLISAKGYPLALLWPDNDSGGVNPVDPLKLSSETQDGVLDFQKL
jgi:hypothetical protein